MREVVITSAVRTPVGRFLGSLAQCPAHDLGALVLKAAAARAQISCDRVSETIMGQVLTAGQGQNPARQAHLKAGFPIESPAWGVNQVCGSGLRAVALAAQHIQLEDADIVAAGGQENMSLSPHLAHMREGQKMGPLSFVDSMMHDGLRDAMNAIHMGVTAENVARRWGISREAQDAFALNSQQKALAAQNAGRFRAEIEAVEVKVKRETVLFSQDEYIRHDATLESLQKLRPAFEKEGTVTAGNASGLNDGAAAVTLMPLKRAEALGVKPLARIASFATVGVDPEVMGIGPVFASQKALKKAGWSAYELDVIEANEAFAAQALAVNKEMDWDPDKVNMNGGAIAIGHPIGASGCRILVTLLHEMMRRNAKKGLATLCVGGGMGVALCVER